MVEDLHDLLKDLGVPLAGQCQIDATEMSFDLTAFDSSWAAERDSTVTVDDSGNSIGASIEALAARITPESLVSVDEDTVDTPLGEQLRHANPVLYQVMQPHLQRFVRRDTITTADLEALKSIAADFSLLAGSPGMEHLPALVTSTDALAHRASQAVLAVQRSTPIVHGPVSPLLTALKSEAQLLGALSQSLAQRSAACRRVDQGFRNFVRSEFWFQRWRIYELWILCRVIRGAQRQGGSIELQGVRDGVWQVKYGRATDPCAILHFPRGRVELYYQLYRANSQGADMPDLALLSPDGGAIVVIDPKHGLSYKRSEFERVLLRYTGGFAADLTAIVNYFPMPTYPYEQFIVAGRHALLASDVRPGSTPAERLELRVTDALLARGFGPRSTPMRPRTPPGPHIPRRPKAGQLVWWAAWPREIDEPEGAWTLDPRMGPVPVEGLPGPDTRFEAIVIAAPTGESCLVRQETAWVVVGHGRRKRELGDIPKPADFIGWRRDGRQLAFAENERLLIVTQSRIKEFPMPAGIRHGAWMADNSLVGVAQSGRGHSLWHFREGEEWREIATIPSPLSLFRSSPFLSAGKEVLFIAKPAPQILHDDGSVVPFPANDPIPLAVSAGGRLRLYDGPKSWNDGVTLLRIHDRETGEDLRLLRFRGWGHQYAFSPDESRVAFLVSDQERQDRLFQARLGDSHAAPVDLPEQKPVAFAWLDPRIIAP